MRWSWDPIRCSPSPIPQRRRTTTRRCWGSGAVSYLDAAEPHVCLYRDGVEVILTLAPTAARPNRELYGYGYDAYFIMAEQARLQAEFEAAGARVVRPLTRTDYHNDEFVVEDPDGRWLAFGLKTG